MKQFVATIDGPSASGKSTVSQMVSKQTGLVCLHSGDLYRCITFEISKGHRIHQHLNKEKYSSIISIAKNLEIEIEEDGYLLNSTFVSKKALHVSKIDDTVTYVSSIPEVRDIVNEKILKVANYYDILAEGRDMGTIVFPQADIKFYLDASIETRARRRFSQHDSTLEYSTLKEKLDERDKFDMQKMVGGLKIDKKAKYIDTSDLTIHEVCEILITSIHSTRKLRSNNINV